MRKDIRLLWFLSVLLLLTSCSPIPQEPRAGPKGTHSSAHGKSAEMTRMPGDARYALELLGSVDGPLTKQPVQVSGGSILFSGWAVEEPKGTVAAGVDVVVDGYPYTATYGAERSDVAAYLKSPAYKNSGFQISIPSADIGGGRHTAAIRVLSNSGKTYWEGTPIAIDVK
jgi:hypothetical protein